jgi:hypothetical protein
MIIHNFVKWLENNLSSLVFIKHNFRSSSPDNCTMVKQNGGLSKAQFDRKEILIQLLTRNIEDNEAFVVTNTIFNLCKRQFMIELPSVTIDSIVYPAVIVAQISPNQTPGGIGCDENGRYMYSFNVTIIFA